MRKIDFKEIDKQRAKTPIKKREFCNLCWMGYESYIKYLRWERTPRNPELLIARITVVLNMLMEDEINKIKLRELKKVNITDLIKK